MAVGTIEDDDAPTGFVTLAIPEEFFISLTTVKGASHTTAEFQHLLNHRSVLEAAASISMMPNAIRCCAKSRRLRRGGLMINKSDCRHSKLLP